MFRPQVSVLRSFLDKSHSVTINTPRIEDRHPLLLSLYCHLFFLPVLCHCAPLPRWGPDWSKLLKQNISGRLPHVLMNLCPGFPFSCWRPADTNNKRVQLVQTRWFIVDAQCIIMIPKNSILNKCTTYKYSCHDFQIKLTMIQRTFST